MVSSEDVMATCRTALHARVLDCADGPRLHHLGIFAYVCPTGSDPAGGGGGRFWLVGCRLTTDQVLRYVVL